MVRAKGLEPSRRRHQNLNLARLPIPPRPQRIRAHQCSNIPAHECFNPNSYLHGATLATKPQHRTRVKARNRSIIPNKLSSYKMVKTSLNAATLPKCTVRCVIIPLGWQAIELQSCSRASDSPRSQPEQAPNNRAAPSFVFMQQNCSYQPHSCQRHTRRTSTTHVVRRFTHHACSQQETPQCAACTLAPQSPLQRQDQPREPVATILPADNIHASCKTRAPQHRRNPAAPS